jgi:phosphoribosyl 1,2-cyclic phosphodiesterase
MRLRLLGTGASDGWPNPWCGCPSCRAAAAAGVVRGQTSALLDDRLMLEIGPEAPRAAVRQGVSLEAALRLTGAVTDTTRLLAIHLGHDNPPPDELDQILAAWGASAPRDGDVLEL